jgi:hypothetical protein
MRVKIRGGTVNHGEPSLCSSCRRSIIVRGARLGDEVLQCGLYSMRDRRITFAVTSCTEYVHRGQPSLWNMEQIAWVLRSNPSGKKVGFVEATKLTEDERHVLEE